MKIEALKEYIRKVVQDEVRNVLKEELKHQLAEIILGGSGTTSIQKKPKVNKVIEQEPILEESVQEVMEQEPTKPKKFIKYTNNDMLNQILNETKGGVPQEGSLVGMVGGYETGIKEQINEVKVPENAPEPVKSVYGAMTKDYRALMKAVDKKRNKS